MSQTFVILWRLRWKSSTVLDTYSPSAMRTMYLTFIGPCIVIYSYSTTNNAPVSHIIYSCKTLYMFRTVFPSIIRSSKLRIQQQACVKQLLVPAASGSDFPSPFPAPKYVERFTRINNLRNRCIFFVL